ncbi:hypothetical protein ACQCVP_14995 [Rossellomorea vietnamensis]
METLNNTMSMCRKICLLLDHLLAGGEVEIDGYTRMRLANHMG